MNRPGISTGQLLERIRDLRSQVTGFTQRFVPQAPLPEVTSSSNPVSKNSAQEEKLQVPTLNGQASDGAVPVLGPLEALNAIAVLPQAPPSANASSWAKTNLVESGLALTGELKAWQVRAESGSEDIAAILDPEEFRAVVRIADAALRLIPAFPTEPELLEPLALALETILQPLRWKIASWHQVAREFGDLARMVQSVKTATEPGQKSALAATLVRFSQKTGRLGLWLLPWEKMQSSEKMILAEAWLASTEVFRGGVWAMHEAAFGALQGKAPPIPPLWGSWLADLETGEKPAGPWSLCQSIEKPNGETHPLEGEWIPVEHPGLGVLLLMGPGENTQNCRALRWGALPEGEGFASVVLSQSEMSILRDLPQTRLRSLLARMMFGGNRS